MNRRRFILTASAATVLSACGVLEKKPEVESKPTAVVPAPRKPKIGLALGGGAARGFAHIGVIKALEISGISPDIVVGTSAGSVVGSLYAAGNDAFALQKLAFQLEESAFTDWAIFERGFLKGEALERFINQQASNRSIEQLKRKFAAVATDLASGEATVFTTGNVGTAVRASSSIPGIFSPVLIRGREYVDGGLTSPVPARAARQLGADIVIAVDISAKPSGKRNQGSIDLLLDTIAVMGTAISRYELHEADIVVRPDIAGLPASSFEQRHQAIMRGEQAGYAVIAKIRDRIAGFGR